LAWLFSIFGGKEPQRAKQLPLRLRVPLRAHSSSASTRAAVALEPLLELLCFTALDFPAALAE